MIKTNYRTELIVSYLSLGLTLAAFILSLIYIGIWVEVHPRATLMFYINNLLFLGLTLVFAYGNLLYQLTRIGYYLRLGARARSDQSGAAFDFVVHGGSKPTLSVLIPSYKEELVTVEQTLLSAALMGYPGKQVCVLLDDPVALPGTPTYEHTQNTLKLVASVTQSIETLHETYAQHYQMAQRRLSTLFDPASERAELAQAYRSLADHLRDRAQAYPARTHTDRLFIQKVFHTPADFYTQQADNVADQSAADTLTPESLLGHYAYLRDLFAGHISVLQRKTYANLSSEPNKAMNINSYLSLMGGSYRRIQDEAGKLRLEPVTVAAAGDLVIPRTDYVITLDADSILDHRYASTLIEIMERPANKRLAVAQTPYSAIGGSDNQLERIAGATTDIQYIIHQGFTKFGATYWVGANALLRTRALDDIAEPIEGETLVKQYIQDRTVIEDTESSIDLINKHWSLYNHPERLAYSATPNDYGSLLIQRRRWANGGLIILPKLLRYLLIKPAWHKIPEGFMRVHYLVSIAFVNLGLLIMLFIPLDDVGFSLWVPLTALPYFLLYCRDLTLLGYSPWDVLRVYALNLLLIPINVGGVLKSLQQLVTGSKIPFGRTPKAGGHTAAPPLYHLVTYGLFFYLLLMIAGDLIDRDYAFAAILTFNALFLGYAIWAFIGPRATARDLGVFLRQLLLPARRVLSKLS